MASPGYDGSIRINTSLDDKGFNAGIARMANSLKTLAASVGIAFGLAAVVNFGKAAVSAASELESAMTGLRSVVEGQGRSFEQAQAFIMDYISDGLVPATNAIAAYKNLALRGYDTSQIEQVMVALKDSAAFGRQASLSLGYAVQSATEGLKNENSILVDNAGVTRNVSQMWKDYADSIGTTVDRLTKQQKIQAEVAGIMNESRFQTGDAAKLTNSYAGQVAALGVAMTNLKVAVGNTIIPIIAKILPYIKAAVDALTVFFNKLARIFSLFFGAQISASVAGVEALTESTEAAAGATENLANSTGKAGKAAKGALAAFDELNVLQMNDASSAGAGSAASAGLSAGISIGNPEEVIPDELAARVDAFKEKLINFLAPVTDALGRMKDALSGIGATIWEGLKWGWENILVPLGNWAITDALPVFLDLLSGALGFLNSVLVALQPVGQWLWDNLLKPMAEWTAQALVDALKWITDRLNDLSVWINENPVAFQNIAIVIGILAGALLLAAAATSIWVAVSGVATAATGVFAAAIAFLTTPVTLIILAIAALIIIIILLVKNWDWVKETAGKVWDWIVEKWNQAGAWFKANVTDPIANWFASAWESVKSFASNAWQGIVDIWNGIGEWFKTNVTDPIKNAFDSVLQWIGDTWESTFGGIRDFVKGIINGIIDFINGMISAVAGGINSVIEGINSIKVTIPSWVPVYGGQSIGFAIPTVAAPQIPRLATGAVIPPNSEFAAILGDQRSGRNLEAPEGLIRQIINEEIGNIKFEATINFAGSMGQLVRELKPYIDKENMRIGGSMIKGSALS